MSALFSCTLCHKRYLFDELSKGEQMCKDCRNGFPTIKCTYCWAEFQQNSKASSTGSICDKCAQNVKHYGKPTACESCSVQAAFIGKRCQRCVNSEKKWGSPVICEQCKLKCAFVRSERRKVNEKLMCWLCDQTYKRVLAKTRQTSDGTLRPSTADSPNNPSINNGQSCGQSIPSSASFEGRTMLEHLTKLATSGDRSHSNTPPPDIDSPAKAKTEDRLVDKSLSFVDDTKSKDDIGDEKRHNKHLPQKHIHQNSSRPTKHHSQESDPASAGSVKKPKLEKNASNAIIAATSASKSAGNNVSEAGLDSLASENVIIITQLREHIESLKKQISGKDQQLLEKEKKITELKAQMYESDKEFRSKIQAMQRSHASAIENLQVKNRELTRNVASLSKTKRSTDSSSVSLTSS
uniref:Protein FAM76A n=2 Tax=Arion vulgaris TaxID=1028688 RepID=A0A0B7A8X1_9EUPU